MTLSKRVEEFLRQERVSFQVLSHPVTHFAALDKANEFHISGKEMLKALILDVDGKYVMCVLPSVQKIDLEKFRDMLHAQNVRMVKEEKLTEIVPACEMERNPILGIWMDLAFIWTKWRRKMTK